MIYLYFLSINIEYILTHHIDYFLLLYIVYIIDKRNLRKFNVHMSKNITYAFCYRTYTIVQFELAIVGALLIDKNSFEFRKERVLTISVRKIAGHRRRSKIEWEQRGARGSKQRNQRTVSFPLRFCMLSVLLFVGRPCSAGPILTLVESRSFFRDRYGYLYNTIYLAPGPRATIAVARRPRRLDSKEISAVTIDYGE